MDNKNMLNSKIEYDKWISYKNLDDYERDELILIRNDNDEILDRFHCELEFGTSGLRGLIGVGTNRMNTRIVNRVTFAIAKYLEDNFHGEKNTVIISYDSRTMSREFAYSVAEILSGKDIKTYIFKKITPVSVLSYSIRKLHASMGIMITASHNPREYNGYKVYNQYGYQILPDEARLISSYIPSIDIFTEYNKDSINIYEIEDEIRDEFLEHLKIRHAYDSGINANTKVNLNIIYTPLYGSGREYVELALANEGFKNVNLVESQALPDASFSTCTTPNPELPGSYNEAFKLYKKGITDIIIATDPDCDRLGVAIVLNGKRKLLTGNELGILFLDFLISYGDIKKGQIIYKSIVSTPLVEIMAKKNGLKIKNTLTGFKYIGELITKLEDSNSLDSFLYAFEESFGYLFDRFIRDKDGITTSILICKMAALYKSLGFSLADRLNDIYAQYGDMRDNTYNYYFYGSDSKVIINKIMNNFRNNVNTRINGFKIVKKLDLLNQTDLPKENTLMYDLDNKVRIILRPSGTEPKLKLYIFGNSGNDLKVWIEKIIYYDESIKK